MREACRHACSGGRPTDLGHEVIVEATSRAVASRHMSLRFRIEAGDGITAEHRYNAIFIGIIAAPFRYRVGRQFDVVLDAVSPRSGAEGAVPRNGAFPPVSACRTAAALSRYHASEVSCIQDRSPGTVGRFFLPQSVRHRTDQTPVSPCVRSLRRACPLATEPPGRKPSSAGRGLAPLRE